MYYSLTFLAKVFFLLMIKMILFDIIILLIIMQFLKINLHN